MKQYIISIFTILSVYIINAYTTYATVQTGGTGTGTGTGTSSGASTGGSGSGPIGIKIINPIKDVTVAELVSKVMDFLIQLGAVVLVLAIVYSGFLFVVAQGRPNEINKAKEAFKWTIIGGAILLGAKIIADVITNTLKELA